MLNNTEHIIGNIVLRPLRAKMFVKTDLFTSSTEGYFKAYFSINSEVVQSEVVKISSEKQALTGSYSLRVCRQYRFLTIEFYDKDTFSKNDLTGVSEFDIEELKKKRYLKSQEIVLEDSKSGATTGNIIFDFEYYDDNDPSDEEEVELDLYQKIREKEVNRKVLKQFEQFVNQEAQKVNTNEPENLLMAMPDFDRAQVKNLIKQPDHINWLRQAKESLPELESNRPISVPVVVTSPSIMLSQENPLQYSFDPQKLKSEVNDINSQFKQENPRSAIDPSNSMVKTATFRTDDLSLNRVGSLNTYVNPLKQSINLKR